MTGCEHAVSQRGEGIRSQETAGLGKVLFTSVTQGRRH